MVDDNKKNNHFKEDKEVSVVEGLPSYQVSGGTEELSIEDMNSTMMGMDLNAFQNETKQNIRIEQSVSENENGIVSKKIIFKDLILKIKKYIQKFSKPQKIETEDTPHDFRFSKRMQGWQGVWIAFYDDQLWQKTFFYLSRLLILLLWGVSYFALAKVVLQSQLQMHPARWFLTAIASVTFVCTLLTLFFKRLSPVWLVSLPLSAFAMLFAYGVFCYSSHDLYYFSFENYKMAQLLNGFYFTIFLFLLCLFWGELTRSVAGYILWTVLCTLSLFTPVYHGVFHLDFETGLFRFGPLAKIEQFYFLPAYLFLHVLTPLWLILFFVKSFSKDPDPKKRSSRSAYLALLPLFTSLLFLAVGLLQSNRVFHLGNYIWPVKMWQGKALWTVMGHPVELSSVLGVQHSTSSQYNSYNFVVRSSTNPKSYEVEVFSQDGQKILGINQNDLQVKIDGVQTADYQWFPHANEEGVYIFKTDLKARDQVLSFNTNKKVWTQSEELILDVIDPLRIAKVDVLENGQVLTQILPPFAEKISVDLKYFTTGEHQLSVVAYATKDQELLRLPIKIAVQDSRDFMIVSPFERDDVAEQISVVLALKGLKESEVRSVRYQINNTILMESKTFQPFVTLSTKDFLSSDLKLTVKLALDTEELEQSISLKKAANEIVDLKLINPTQGAFASNDTEVVYQVATDQSLKVLGIKVKVNGLNFDEFEVKENRFTLPVSRWKGSEVYISLQATLDSGNKVSDWVQINRGQSALKMQFIGSEFLNFGKKKPILIFDASQSTHNFWFKDKLLSIFKQVLLLPEVSSKFGEEGVKIFALGGDVPLYYQNCKSVNSVFDGMLHKPLLKKSLDHLQPQGHRSLKYGLQMALQDKPRDVIVFTQGFDTCGQDFLTSLPVLLTDSPNTHLSLFWFGDALSLADQKQLQTILRKTDGDLFEPENYENFIKLFSDVLSVNFLVKDSNKILLEEPLKDGEFNLPPGDYVLQLPVSEGFKDIPLHLEHGLKKTLVMSLKDKKIIVEESVSPL